jgi:hypothetical protein
MAKKRKEALQPMFVPQFRRRHPHLFLPKLLSERATLHPFDTQRLETAGVELLRWADLAEKGGLKHKETALDAEFLHGVFGVALGYKDRTENPNAFTLDREYTTPGPVRLTPRWAVLPSINRPGFTRLSNAKTRIAISTTISLTAGPRCISSGTISIRCPIPSGAF